MTRKGKTPLELRMLEENVLQRFWRFNDGVGNTALCTMLKTHPIKLKVFLVLKGEKLKIDQILKPDESQISWTNDIGYKRSKNFRL